MCDVGASLGEPVLPKVSHSHTQTDKTVYSRTRWCCSHGKQSMICRRGILLYISSQEGTYTKGVCARVICICGVNLDTPGKNYVYYVIPKLERLGALFDV